MNKIVRGPLPEGSILWGLIALLALTACGQGPDAAKDGSGKAAVQVQGKALAVVDQEQIDSPQLREFERKMQEAHRSQKEGYEAHLEHLHSMVDAKLMALEAAERGLEGLPDVRYGIDLTRRRALIDTYLRKTVGAGMTVTREELIETFKGNPGHESVKAAHILVETQQQADSLFALIGAGADFAELARKHSLDEDTAPNGGAFDKYYEFSRVSYSIFSQVFDKKVGELVPPFKTSRGWEIVKVLDRKEVDFEKYRPQVFETAMARKFIDRRNAHLDSLVERYNVQRDEDFYALFVKAWNLSPGSPDLGDESASRPLYTFDGGLLTAQQAINVMANTYKGQAKVTPESLHQHLVRYAIGDMLFYQAGVAAGFDEDPDVLAAVAEERQKRLMKALWDQVLEEEVTATAAEAQAHYEAHPELYKAPGEVVVREVLLPSRQEAEEVMAQIEAGADMGQLAADRSIRKLAVQSSGVYGIRGFERMIYKNLLDASMEAPLEQLQGPLQIPEPMPSTLVDNQELEYAYSVYKVLERRPRRVMPFDDPEATRRSFFYARQKKQQDRLANFTEELRQKYRARWAISEENLRAYAETVGG